MKSIPVKALKFNSRYLAVEFMKSYGYALSEYVIVNDGGYYAPAILTYFTSEELEKNEEVRHKG